MSWTASLVTDLLFFGVYFGFSGGCILAGAKLMRRPLAPSRRGAGGRPSPRPRGDILIIRRPGFPFIPFCILVALVGWLCVLGWAADLLGWIPAGKQPPAAGEQPLVLLIVGGIFAASGHGLLSLAVSITFDLRQRTWRVVRGVWPLRSVKSGDLDEASKVAVAEETRTDEDGAEVRFVVARLVWSDPSRPDVAPHRASRMRSTAFGDRSDQWDSITARRSAIGRSDSRISWRYPWSIRPRPSQHVTSTPPRSSPNRGHRRMCQKSHVKAVG